MIPLRIIALILLLITALFLPWWIFVILATCYTLAFSPYDVLVVAVIIDAQFGNPMTGLWYQYTLFASILLVSSLYIKPRLSLYQ